MTFQISALPAKSFAPLYGLSDAALAERGAVRMPVDGAPGFPCRVSLADAEIGETVILLQFEHQPEATPFRASGPIFVKEGAKPAPPGLGNLPEASLNRALSVRAYDAGHMMIDAQVTSGEALRGAIARFWGNDAVAYLHVHFATRGCYACRIDRA